MASLTSSLWIVSAPRKSVMVRALRVYSVNCVNNHHWMSHRITAKFY